MNKCKNTLLFILTILFFVNYGCYSVKKGKPKRKKPKCHTCPTWSNINKNINGYYKI